VILVDTNVLFSLVVDSDLSQAAVRLHEQDDDWRSEFHALVELTNVLARYIRNGKMTAEEGRLALAAAEDFMDGNLYSVAHADALELTFGSQVSAYDARFLAAAISLQTKLVTEDRKLRNAAPELTCSLEDAIAAFSQ
jgi:predicted nucleic acid-binding protein